MAFVFSFIGSFIALELGAWWWVGLAFGFAAGYVGYDVRAFGSGIARAFAETRKVFVSKETLRLAFHAFGCVISLFASFLVLLLGADYFSGFSDNSLYYFVGSAGLCIGLLFMTPGGGESITLYEKIIMIIHPIPLFLWVLPRGIWWLIAKGIPLALRFCKSFIATAYRYVHSNARLLFGIDIAIGVAVGYYTGNALLGGLAGGCWWLLDWHLISVRVMGLKAA